MRVYLDLPAPELRRVQAYAAVTRQQPSSLVRAAIAEYLDRHVGDLDYQAALRAAAGASAPRPEPGDDA